MERRSPMDALVGSSSPIRHVRAPSPLVFPVEADVPESRRHLILRTFLFTTFRRAFGDRAAIGSDQFVYFRASDPRKSLAPDLIVRLAAANDDFETWKTWERGAPHLGVEIVSPNERPWAEKLADYHEAGFVEVVRFDADAPAGARLRVWDRVEGDLVERMVEGDRTPSTTLGGHWVVAPVPDYDVALRLEDAKGIVFPSPEEAAAAAEARVAELEGELARLGGR